jgi:hypothetical protein
MLSFTRPRSFLYLLIKYIVVACIETWCQFNTPRVIYMEKSKSDRWSLCVLCVCVFSVTKFKFVCVSN